MALAPLDVWARLLFCPAASIPIRYWPRLFFALATSAMVTVVTLLERLLLGLWFLRKAETWLPTSAPIFILGYYRTGTTHLQYLLNLDPALFSPKWCHALVPQGFVFSWTFFRYFLIPFLPATRRIDAMDINPDLPAEDDFALNNWALASALPAWILPEARRFYGRFHDLRALGPAERNRWRRYLIAFVRKLSLVCGSKRLLLKSPCHTARVDVLLELFPGAKYIHISRDPRQVIQSNVRLVTMMQRLFGFQAPPSRETIENEVARRYIATEQRYLEVRDKIPKGHLAEVRMQDLLADPLGEIKRIYGELDLPFARVFERGLLAYLRSQSGYTPNVHPPWSEEQERRLALPIAGLIEPFQLDRPAVPAVELPKLSPSAAGIRRSRKRLATLAGLGTAIGCAALWLTIVPLTGSRQSWIVWPVGIAVGSAILRVAGSGSRVLGLWSCCLTVLVLLVVLITSDRVIQFAAHSQIPLAALWDAAIRGVRLDARLFWSFMGLTTAYRLGSRPFSRFEIDST